MAAYLSQAITCKQVKKRHFIYVAVSLRPITPRAQDQISWRTIICQSNKSFILSRCFTEESELITIVTAQ